MGVLFDAVTSPAPGFREQAALDVEAVFLNPDEFAKWYTVDGKRMKAVLVKEDVRNHRAHWEAGAKQNFDTGLYNTCDILYVKTQDYGHMPKQGKTLILDGKRTYHIKKCEEQGGVYRITMERVRQG